MPQTHPRAAWTRTWIWARTTSLSISLGWMVSATACGTSSASVTPDSQSPVAATAVAGDRAPAHVFTPRPHPPRVHELPPPPDLARLPRMIDRHSTCFAPELEDQGGWVPRPPKRAKPKRKKRRPPGFVPYAGGDKGGSAKPTETRSGGGRRSKPASSGSSTPGGVAGGVPGGVVGGVLGGVSSGDGRARGSSPPAESRPVPKLDARPEPEPARVAQEPPWIDSDVASSDRDVAGPAIATGSDPSFDQGSDQGFDDWGSATYLSNDDTMSLSSAQRVIYAIDHFLPLPAEHIRPHELLNYFSFDTTPVGPDDDFSVRASIAPDPHEEGSYSLAMAVKGRPLTVEERRNVNLSIVVDRSGSMSAQGRMEYLQRGLDRVMGQLKEGDMVHLVLFDHEVCTPVENFVVGRDRPQVLRQAIRSLEPRGSTNLHDGLREGYRLADRAYQPTYSNRVVMITDAIANRGVTDEQLIATVSKFYDERRIRMSGVGVGRDFNDSLLDQLTERGKGAYVFLGSEAEVDAVFGSRFTSLVETTALDVHFRLHLPPSLRLSTFYGEESSTIKEDVQAIHYFANTSQLFLSDLMARGGQLRSQDSVMLTVEYEDPDSGEERVEEYAFNLGEISQADRNVRKGRLVMQFVDGLAWMASRPVPVVWAQRDESWADGDAWEACEAGRRELSTMARGLEDDPEVSRVQGLWDRYCARYARPRAPVRRPSPDRWPGASG
ncbi:MAG: VWA domain-containing protein [Myxococcota bacterium]